MIAADTDRLSDLLADDFTAVHITGYKQSKSEWLGQIRAGEMAYTTYAKADGIWLATGSRSTTF